MPQWGRMSEKRIILFEVKEYEMDCNIFCLGKVDLNFQLGTKNFYLLNSRQNLNWINFKSIQRTTKKTGNGPISIEIHHLMIKRWFKSMTNSPTHTHICRLQNLFSETLFKYFFFFKHKYFSGMSFNDHNDDDNMHLCISNQMIKFNNGKKRILNESN